MSKYKKGIQIKIALLMTGIIISLLGVGYASWTDGTTIRQKVGTGQLAFEMSDLTPVGESGKSLYKLVNQEETWAYTYNLSKLENSLQPAAINEVFEGELEVDVQGFLSSKNIQYQYLCSSEAEEKLLLSMLAEYLGLPSERYTVEVHHTFNPQEMRGTVIFAKPMKVQEDQNEHQKTRFLTSYQDNVSEILSLLEMEMMREAVSFEYKLMTDLGFDQFNIKGATR